MLTGAIAFAVAALLRGRDGRAVPALLLSLAKPQLFVVAIPALLLRHRRLIVAVVASGIAIVVAATLLMPHWLDAWPRYVPASRITDPPRAAVPASLAVVLLGPVGTAVAEAALVLLTIVIAVRFGLASVPGLAAWVALSVLAAPYAWSYDWLLLQVPFVLGVSALWPDRPALASALTVTGTVLLTLVAAAFYAVAVETGSERLSSVVPIAFALVLVIAMWPVARRAD